MEEKKQEAVEQVKNEVDEAIAVSKFEDIVKNATPEFEYQGEVYRVKKPTFAQKKEAYEKKVEKFNELLDDDKYFLEDVLKEKYKKKGIDIDKIMVEMTAIENEKNKLKLKLGEILTRKPVDEASAESLSKEIDSLDNKQYMLSIKRTNLLQYSVENQVLIYLYQYLTYVVTEKLVKGKDLGEGNKEPDSWVKAWSSFDDFISSDESLVNQASYNATLVIGQL